MNTFLLLLAFLLSSHVSLAAGAPLAKIRFAYPSAGTLISLQVGDVLRRTDIAERHGIKLETTPMNLGKELKIALASNKVDVIFTSESNFVVLAGQGVPCRAFSTLGSGGDMALVVNAKSPVKNIADLKGKKVGTIFGTSLHQPSVEWLREAGLVAGKDVTIVNLGTVGALQSGLVSGFLDATMTLDPFLTDQLLNHRIRVLKRTQIDLIAVANKDFATKNKDALHRFNETVREAVFYFAQHKAEVNGWAAEESKIVIDVLDKASKSNSNYSAKNLEDVDLKISSRFRKKLDRLAKFLYQEKLVQTLVNPDDFILKP